MIFFCKDDLKKISESMIPRQEDLKKSLIFLVILKSTIVCRKSFKNIVWGNLYKLFYETHGLHQAFLEVFFCQEVHGEQS